MRTATTIEAASFNHWSQQRDFVVEAETLGLDVLWVAEAWGRRAVGAGLLRGMHRPHAAGFRGHASRDSNASRVGAGCDHAVEPVRGTVSARPGRSGPQVIEGLHGVSFARPALSS